MQEPLFHQLRTKEQLGYSVSCFGCPGGFIVTVHSTAHKLTTEYVNERIENFLKDFINILKQMSEDEFKVRKEYFNKSRKCGDVCLKDEVDRNWFAVNVDRPDFDERDEEIYLINSLRIDELRHWLVDHVEKKLRKLSIQIQGNVNGSGENQ